MSQDDPVQDPLITVGGRRIERQRALSFASRYLSGTGGWSYPSYELYESAAASGPLRDADFLAPVLLNVNHLRIAAYEALQKARPRLDAALTEVPLGTPLVDASPEVLQKVAACFAVLDDGTPLPGVRGTTLAKILHRKRPELIPLYDARVFDTYSAGVLPRIPPRRKGEPARGWQEYMGLLATEMQKDLAAEPGFWAEITALAVDPPITPLRSLDIIAWGAPDFRRADAA